MDRLDALVARKDKDGKTHWTRIGVAFPTKSGGGWNIYLDANPIDGKLTLFPPKPRGNANDRPNSQAQNAKEPDLDDEIPF